jgi:poly-gamma-glutamate capsule biosynthesis protein CapA/YwtB (metallophosphatase superfamily)
MIAIALVCVLSGTPVSAKSPTATLLFSGDVTLGFHYEEYVDEQVSKGKSKDAMLGWGFEQVKSVTQKADVYVANLECPFTAGGEKIVKNFNFRARPEFVSTLLAGGVDVVSLANNHLMDYGPEGLFDTLSTLETNKIKSFGAGRSLSEARAPLVIEVKGIKVAFLGYFFLGDKNIEPSVVIATQNTPGVAGHFSSLEELKKMVSTDILAAKQVANHVIPFFHWGKEGTTTPQDYQIELAHFAIDNGASAVIGSHPHVLQGIEVYKNAPIAYSLGNFVFGGNWNPKDKKTALLQLKIDSKSIRDVEVIPAFSDAYPQIPVQPYLAQDEKAREVLWHLKTISKQFKKTIGQLTKLTEGPKIDLTDAGVR